MLPHKNGPLIRFIYIGDTFLTVKCDKTLYILPTEKAKWLKSCIATKLLQYVNGSSSGGSRYSCHFPLEIQVHHYMSTHSPLPIYNIEKIYIIRKILCSNCEYYVQSGRHLTYHWGRRSEKTFALLKHSSSMYKINPNRNKIVSGNVRSPGYNNLIHCIVYCLICHTKCFIEKVTVQYQ